MKIGLILALALTLLVVIGSAAIDDAILVVNKALLLEDNAKANLSVICPDICPDRLTESGKWDSYFNITLGEDTLMISKNFMSACPSIPESYITDAFDNMTRIAETIIQQHPDRFKKLDLKVYDASNTLISHATFAALNSTEWKYHQPDDTPKPSSPA
jgi:hypothetical protein